MKKILVVGSGDSVFVKDFVSQIAAQDVIVDLLSISPDLKNENVRTQVSVALEDSRQSTSLTRQIKLFFKIRRALRQLDDGYDAVVIHFIFFFLAPHIFLLRAKGKNIVAVVWGSDFYRSGQIKKIFQRVVYHFSNSIVFTNPATKNKFEIEHAYLESDRLKVARFGLPVLDEIKKLNSGAIGRREICIEFNLPVEKVLIFAGYNANLSQQQIFIIKKFSELNDSVKENAALVFTLGYGDASAESKIKSALNAHGVRGYVILNKFYGVPDIAKIRRVTDVLINIQPSDQFSGSMQEALYAGGRVIAGKWLPYDELISAGAKIKSISTLEELGSAIELEIKNGIKSKNHPNVSTQIFIENASSWTTNIKIWNAIIFQ